MKIFVVCFIALLSNFTITFSQEIPIPESLKTVPYAKCYWSYSVERLSTKNDVFHKYSIRVSIAQVDSNRTLIGKLKLRDVKIYCSFVEDKILKKVHFKRVGPQWIAKFKIYTNEPLPLKIIAKYNHQERIMSLKLNQSYYPGESDN